MKIKSSDFIRYSMGQLLFWIQALPPHRHHLHTHLHTDTHTNPDKHTKTHRDTDTGIQTHTQTHTDTHTHTDTQAHTHTQTHRHTHPQTRQCSGLSGHWTGEHRVTYIPQQTIERNETFINSAHSNTSRHHGNHSKWHPCCEAPIDTSGEWVELVWAKGQKTPSKIKIRFSLVSPSKEAEVGGKFLAVKTFRCTSWEGFRENGFWKVATNYCSLFW